MASTRSSSAKLLSLLLGLSGYVSHAVSISQGRETASWAAASDRALALLQTVVIGEKSIDIKDVHPGNRLQPLYKLPTAFLLSGNHAGALRTLDIIDAIVDDPVETTSGALSFFPDYMCGWVAMGAQRTGRFDIARKYQRKCEEVQDQHDKKRLDTLSFAHRALLAMYFGRMDEAEEHAFEILRIVGMNFGRSRDGGDAADAGTPPQDFYFHLNAEKDGLEMTDDMLHVISRSKRDQAYFFLGYPAAVLALMSQAFKSPVYLDTSRMLVDYLDSIPGMRTCPMSHKVMWASAQLFVVTGESKYEDIASDIADNFVQSQQPLGHWGSGSREANGLGRDGSHEFFSKLTADELDQTAEISIWLRLTKALVEERRALDEDRRIAEEVRTKEEL
uniref:Tetratricopeptide repeat protein 38 n=1 Tax=Lotharella globosa TaxID=91324 RepID=A0A7S3Z2Z7_9EUKA|eukprot:CAMPEP_0167783314 /NCGR_PEP_ID=MMETSP0111_2-20121227/7002_1 /TAXON_ID=91324 /ORGANISM="Lotharella globosa, Strain CCCM811" /LENGTH=389 /DNA_ID=CAMNT_0007674239 /DNA_START=36 /DNA_END=1205 /DNA_ORIENTATION=-